MTKERVLLFAVGALAVCLVGVVIGQKKGIVSAAQAAPPFSCSDALLNGRYSFTEEGYLTNATTFPQAVGAFAPAAGVGYLVADGHGNLTGSDTISVGGELISRASTGTYSINADCTATVQLQFTPGGALQTTAVLDPNGRTFRSLQVSPTGAVFTALGSKSN